MNILMNTSRSAAGLDPMKDPNRTHECGSAVCSPIRYPNAFLVPHASADLARGVTLLNPDVGEFTHTRSSPSQFDAVIVPAGDVIPSLAIELA